MIWKARVLLEPYPNNRAPPRELGILDVNGVPRELAHVKVSVDGLTEVGVIEHIDPAGWQPELETIPTVHISLPRR